MKIGIVGAGHAGVSAAREAIKYGAEITLFSEERCLPYYRPRIPSAAFLQSSEKDIFMHPTEWYSSNKIQLVLGTKIVHINTNDRSLAAESGASYKFDRIIIATGAKPVIPPFAKNFIGKGEISTLWTLNDAIALRQKVSSIKNIAIIGGGAIGIEAALRALDAGLNVSIIEKSPALMSRNLSKEASSFLSNTLIGKGISLITGAEIKEIYDKKNRIEIATDSGIVSANFVLLCIGGIPDTKIDGLPETNHGTGIEVDFNAKTHFPNLFAAGDAALVNNVRTPCSALKANEQGKVAGFNAVRNDNFAEYKITEIPIEIKFKDFKLPN